MTRLKLIAAILVLLHAVFGAYAYAKTDTTVTLTSSPNPSTYGQTVTFTATVTPSLATGSVAFKDNGTTIGTASLSNGVATYNTSALAIGSHSMTAVYQGSSQYDGSTSSPAITQVVNRTPTSVSLTAIPNPSTFGVTVTFTASVSPVAATGSVTFNDGGTTLGTSNISGGTAKIAVLRDPALVVGSHSITATYNGDSNYDVSTSSAVTQIVNKANPTIALTSSLNPSTFGSGVTFTATISPSLATGTITFLDSGTQIGSGTITSGIATATISNLAAASHSITASYGGDANDNGATSTALNQAVNVATSTLTLISSDNPSTYGDSVTFTATPSPSLATGTVTFNNDGSPMLNGTVAISNGTALYTTSTLTGGTHSITAAYGGDANDSGSSASLQQNVNPAQTTCSLTSQPNPSTIGVQVAFVASVSPSTATGTVTFLEGSNTLSTGSLSQGAATYRTATLAAGTHAVTAVYGGDQNYSGCTSGTVNQQVNEGGDFVQTTGQMSSARYSQAATRLLTGQILVTGGMSSSGVLTNAETYTPGSQVFAAAASPMNVPRWLHSSTLLNDGTVLIAGGSDLANKETLDTAEIYNPTAGTFTLLTSTLNTARVGHTATLLNNGQVLIVGGYDPDFGLIADAELYDPPTQTFIDLGDTNSPRYQHTATMLQNGKVLIAGGDADPTPNAAFNSAELFDPVAQVFTSVPVPMTAMREGHAAALLNNGQVLITGGDLPGTGSLSSAEVYDPTSNTFAALTSTMTVPRITHAMNLLNGGKVLITGGATDASGSSTPLSSAEVYDPASQTFTATSSMTSVRDRQSTSLLNDGTVLVDGGTDGVNILNTAELYMTSQLKGLASITIAPASPTIGLGLQQAFTAVGTFGDGSSQNLASAIWSSSNAGVATVTNDSTDFGSAASLAQGTTTISAAASGITGSSSLTIGAPTLVSIQLVPQDSTLPVGATQQFTATGVYSDGSTQDLTSTATWSSSGVAAGINSGGLAAAMFQGVTVIQASSGSISASTNLSVSSPALASIAVTPTSATLAVGASQQFDALGTYTDGSTLDVTTLVGWSSSATTIATVSATGLAVGTGQGSTAITASFESVSASVPISVGTANLVSIAVTPNAGALTLGGTQQLTATAQYSDGTTQNVTSSSSWASSNSGILNVSEVGLATAAAAGEATITATFGSFTGTSVLIVNSATTQASLNTSRYLHSATILETGQILIAGGINCPSAGSCTYLNSAEIYDPSSSTFTNTTGQLAQARSAPSVLLNNGNVLVSGGYFCDSSGNCSSQISAEIYNPSTSTFSGAGNMTVARDGQTMTLLGDGTVLIAGGETCTSATSCTALSSAEIYDPVAGTFSATQNGMSAARYGASAVALGSGSVLIVGGFDGANLPAAAEIYDPTQPGFALNRPNLNTPRYYATATLLNSGKVLVSGGSTCGSPGCPTNAAEIYDPAASAFSTVTNGMNVPRFDHTATLLTNGQVVVAGGYSACSSSCTSEASTETFDPVAGVFNLGQAVATPLAGQTSTLVANGNALFVGGINAGITLGSDEWYQPTSLTPPNLVSITLTPASTFLIPGQTQQLVANGTFSDGSTQTLQSVIWNTSNPSAALVSNSPGNAGMVTAQGTGSTTVTATAGNVGGSASLSVAGLVSISLAPANPSLTIGQGQQMTAMGTFSDGSAHDVTTLTTWTSSNNSVAIVGTTPGFQGYVMGATSGTATVTATLGTISAMTSVSVQQPAVVNPPSVTSANPPTGQAGSQITIFGSSFGSSQGGGQVWLGSTYASVVNWGDQQIVAVVAPNSTSGVAQVQQNGTWSNAIPFNVNTANILTVSPNNGVPGTTVTINGSGFGASQGSGQVWLGTAYGIVQNWSDGQIIAQVGTGSTSGNAQVLQSGVWSNTVPFTVNSLNITQISPNSGGPGTTVTVNGTGFGASQGSGIVWIGSTNGDVISWSDTQVIATVDAAALSGVVRIEQNDQWSNAETFTVPSGGSTLTLNPNMLNLVVGETHAIDAVNPSGQQVTGLTWASSNSQIVSLSQDDPPILTALAAGHVTITAGSASADVTVCYPGTLPLGTVLWSNPGDGSGVISIVPAVPSASGVADIFAFNASGTVSAIKTDGTTAWTASLPQGAAGVPDFQGGLVVANTSNPQSTQSINRLDGMTGSAYPAYTVSPPPVSPYGTIGSPLSQVVVHTDGTIFSIKTDYDSQGYPLKKSLVAIDPTTGTQKFVVQMDNSSSSGFVVDICPFGNPNNIGPHSANLPPQVLGSPIIAGDGYAYIPYLYGIENCAMKSSNTAPYWTGSDRLAVHLVLLRVGSDGSSSKIDVKDWNSTYELPPSGGCGTQSGIGWPLLGNESMIANADQGVLVSWSTETGAYWTGICGNTVPYSSTSELVTTSGTSISSSGTVNLPIPPGYGMQSSLQAQNGTFIGWAVLNLGSPTYTMFAFDGSGRVKWTVPNELPQIATADGGIIGDSGITYDNQGNATGQLPSAIQSWTGSESGIAYQYGSVDQITFTPAIIYSTPDFSSFSGANQSGSGTSALCLDNRDKLIAEYPKYSAGYLPVCFASQFVPSSNSNPDPDFSFSVLNQDDIQYDDYPDWAILKASMLTGLENILTNYGKPITVKSAYRSPYVQHTIDAANIKAGKYKKPSPQSRHLHGDAVDIRTSFNLATWQTLHDIARTLAPKVCIEPYQKSTLDHIHIDWRPISQCSAEWQK